MVRHNPHGSIIANVNYITNIVIYIYTHMAECQYIRVSYILIVTTVVSAVPDALV